MCGGGVEVSVCAGAHGGEHVHVVGGDLCSQRKHDMTFTKRFKVDFSRNRIFGLIPNILCDLLPVSFSSL